MKKSGIKFRLMNGENVIYRDVFDFPKLIKYRGKPFLFTGAKDKNGIEIYEGDIVKWKSYNDKPIISTVKWDKSGGFIFKYKDKFYKRAEWKLLGVFNVEDYLKVIGRNKNYKPPQRNLRFWNRKEKEMIYLPLDFNTKSIFHQSDEVYKIMRSWNYDLIPMLGSGIKDINGKEVYEGDIIDGEGYDVGINESVVFFRDGGFMAEKTMFGLGISERVIGLFGESCDVEVIGNVFEK